MAVCEKCECNLGYLSAKPSIVILPRVVRYCREDLTEIGEDFRSITRD